jgi:hypothetical protein
VTTSGGKWLLVCLALTACKKAPAPEPEIARAAPVQEEAQTPRADQAVKDDEDASWLMGMWKEDGRAAFLLFNPGEVAELVGRPVKVTRRGKLHVHGKYVALVFDTQELHYEASSDRSELASDDIRHVYRRGAPP